MKFFNTTNIAAFFITSTMMLTSCESVKNANNQQKGTVIGTAAGAVIGGVLGNNLGKGKNAPAFSCCFINVDGQNKIDVETKDTFKVIYPNGVVTDDWVFNKL